MSSTTIVVILVVIVVLGYGGYTYGPWRPGTTTQVVQGPGYGFAPIGIGGLLLVVFVLWALGVLR